MSFCESPASASSVPCVCRLENARQQPVHHPERHETVPTECAAMYVGDRIAGVVRQRVYTFDRQQLPFKSRHSAKGDRDNEEFQHWIGRDLVSCPAKRQQSVDHPAPRRHPKHDREIHPQATAFRADVARHNKRGEVFEISAINAQGTDLWIDWLIKRIKKAQHLASHWFG